MPEDHTSTQEYAVSTQEHAGPFGSYTHFARHALLATGIFFALSLLLVVLFFALHVLLVVFAGVLLAILVRTPADWLALHTALSEKWSIALVLTTLVGALVLGGFFFAPQVNEQVLLLLEKLPESQQQARSWLEDQAIARWILDALSMPVVSSAGEGLAGFATQAAGMGYTAVQILFGIMILLFVAVYLAAQPELYIKGILRLVPLPHRPQAAEVLGATGYTLRWWLIGSLIRMTAVSLMTFIALWSLGAPLPLALAIVAFFLDFVPYFGPIVAAIPGVLLAFIDGPQQAMYVLIAYIVLQQIESLVISPIIYHRTIYLPPVLTILAQVLLFGMVGTLGVILATPLTAVFLIWIKMLYVERLLGDRIKTPVDDMNEAEKPCLPLRHEHQNHNKDNKNKDKEHSESLAESNPKPPGD